jgi:ankyrin repeat protein
VYLEMVELLLDFSANLDVRMVNGRTLLMEAAIWGCLENVKCLLSYRADMSIIYIQEGKLLCIIDFAINTGKNSEE